MVRPDRRLSVDAEVERSDVEQTSDLPVVWRGNPRGAREGAQGTIIADRHTFTD
jgi:hypothetical protein